MVVVNEIGRCHQSICYTFGMKNAVSSSSPISPDEALSVARQVLEIEAEAIRHLMSKLDDSFTQAVNAILNCQGRVVVSGMGKSGHIARKIASTLASTGTPAFFVHPAEASHGDLGMVTRQDVMIGLSHSGESNELLAIVPVLKRQGASLIAVTGNPSSALASQADIHLYAGVLKEACPLNLAPTASTTAALALGDALAVALMHARGFTKDQFALSHPGGALGRRLLTLVSDVMRKGPEVPVVNQEVSIMQAMVEMSRKSMGMTAVVDTNVQVIAIFTDGDLRRSIEKGVDLRVASIAEVMTLGPQTIFADRMAVEAVEVMDRTKTNQLLVVNRQGVLVGALNMHDLFRAKVV